MKLIDLVKISNVFKPNMRFSDIKVGYKVMKFLKSIEDDCNFYNSELATIAQECVDKDGDKFKTTKNGDLILKKDKIEEWNNRVSDLGNMEIKTDIPHFKLEDFAECNFSLGDLNTLENLISE